MNIQMQMFPTQRDPPWWRAIFFVRESCAWRAAMAEYGVKSWNAPFRLARFVPSSRCAGAALQPEWTIHLQPLFKPSGWNMQVQAAKETNEGPLGEESILLPSLRALFLHGRSFPFNPGVKVNARLQRCKGDPGVCKRVPKGKAISLQVFGHRANLRHSHVSLEGHQGAGNSRALSPPR